MTRIHVFDDTINFFVNSNLCCMHVCICCVCKACTGNDAENVSLIYVENEEISLTDAINITADFCMIQADSWENLGD